MKTLQRKNQTQRSPCSCPGTRCWTFPTSWSRGSRRQKRSGNLLDKWGPFRLVAKDHQKANQPFLVGPINNTKYL